MESKFTTRSRHRRDTCSTAWRCRFLTARRSQRHHRWLMSTGTYDENGEWQGEQKEYKEVEKIVHKEVIKEVTVGVSEEELSKVRDRVEINR